MVNIQLFVNELHSMYIIAYTRCLVKGFDSSFAYGYNYYYSRNLEEIALVAELEYALRLGRSPARVTGSSPVEGTIKNRLKSFWIGRFCF